MSDGRWRHVREGDNKKRVSEDDGIGGFRITIGAVRKKEGVKLYKRITFLLK